MSIPDRAVSIAANSGQTLGSGGPVSHNTRTMDAQQPPAWVSSDDFVTGHYRPHGVFRLCTQGPIVRYEATGPFNLQAVQGLALARQFLLQRQRPSGCIAAVVHFHGSAVMAADALLAWEQGLKQFAAQRVMISGVAWVAGPEVEGVHFLLSRYQRIFEAAQLPFAFFEDIGVACQWAQQQLQGGGLAL